MDAQKATRPVHCSLEQGRVRPPTPMEIRGIFLHPTSVHTSQYRSRSPGIYFKHWNGMLNVEERSFLQNSPHLCSTMTNASFSPAALQVRVRVGVRKKIPTHQEDDRSDAEIPALRVTQG